MTSALPTINIVLPIVVNGRLFKQQTQYCFTGTDYQDLPCCGRTKVYLVECEGVTYAIPEEYAVETAVKPPEVPFQEAYYNDILLDKTRNYDGTRMKPCVKKIWADTNIISVRNMVST